MGFTRKGLSRRDYKMAVLRMSKHLYSIYVGINLCVHTPCSSHVNSIEYIINKPVYKYIYIYTVYTRDTPI